MIAPDLGVIIIEVKGWYLDDIVRGNHSEVTINAERYSPETPVIPASDNLCKKELMHEYR